MKTVKGKLFIGIALIAVVGLLVTACPTALPANLSVSNLSVTPAEVEAGQAVTISVTASNTGEEEGSFSIILEINGDTEETKTVTIAADDSAQVSFTVTRPEGGIFTVDIFNLSGSFTVTGEIGLINAAGTGVGLEPIAWLVEHPLPYTDVTLPGPLHTNNFALVAVGVWMWTGFAMVILSAGLKGISTDILEAARVDGASELQIFWRIILPVLSPTIAVVATTLVIQALKKFDMVWVMTAGNFGTDVVATLMFKEMFNFRDFGRAAALAVVLLAAILPIMLISIRRFRAQEET